MGCIDYDGVGRNNADVAPDAARRGHLQGREDTLGGAFDMSDGTSGWNQSFFDGYLPVEPARGRTEMLLLAKESEVAH